MMFTLKRGVRNNPRSSGHGKLASRADQHSDLPRGPLHLF